MASIFSKIVAGEIPSYKIYEDDKYFVFLDVFPLKKGHTLVIPKQEVDYMFDLDDDTIAGLYVLAKKVGIALKKAVPCKRIGQAVLGLEVPHAHLHLVPINTESDLRFNNEKLKLAPEEMEEIAASIRSYLEE
ncbi:HIT family protein [Algivirga pacifica]|uniref:HIT family protein n=1 Tax=Algivirga pacifica TaxID=1162670 RepID=A0ABP9DQS6_9BACT